MKKIKVHTINAKWPRIGQRVLMLGYRKRIIISKIIRDDKNTFMWKDDTGSVHLVYGTDKWRLIPKISKV